MTSGILTKNHFSWPEEQWVLQQMAWPPQGLEPTLVIQFEETEDTDIA